MLVNVNIEKIHLIKKLADESGYSFDEVIDICLNIGTKSYSKLVNNAKEFAEWYVKFIDNMEKNHDSK